MELEPFNVLFQESLTERFRAKGEFCMLYQFPAGGGGSSSTTNQKLPFGKARVYIDDAAGTGVPGFGAGTLTFYIKRADDTWSPWATYTTEGGLPSNPFVMDFGPAEAEVYAALSGASGSDMYIEIIPAQTW